MEGQSVRAVAQSLGINERTVYKWLARYRVEGRVGLRDRSSRPRRIPRQTSRRDREMTYRLRRRRMVAAVLKRATSPAAGRKAESSGSAARGRYAI